jgi:hypothetical protein
LLDQYVEGKHYLHASQLLVKSFNALLGDDLLEVGALVDLRKDIFEKKNVKKNIFVFLIFRDLPRSVGGGVA